MTPEILIATIVNTQQKQISKRQCSSRQVALNLSGTLMLQADRILSTQKPKNIVNVAALDNHSVSQKQLRPTRKITKQHNSQKHYQRSHMFEYTTGDIVFFLLYNQAMLRHTSHWNTHAVCCSCRVPCPLSLLLAHVRVDVHWMDGPVFPYSWYVLCCS